MSRSTWLRTQRWMNQSRESVFYWENQLFTNRSFIRTSSHSKNIKRFYWLEILNPDKAKHHRNPLEMKKKRKKKAIVTAGTFSRILQFQFLSILYSTVCCLVEVGNSRLATTHVYYKLIRHPLPVILWPGVNKIVRQNIETFWEDLHCSWVWYLLRVQYFLDSGLLELCYPVTGKTFCALSPGA